ncbi:hypothetical protein ACFL6S_00965 [Candidatus Poribacteria bacterium]
MQFLISDFRFLIAVKSKIVNLKLRILKKELDIITELDFDDYLPNLENYENRLARGEIKW